MISLKNILLCTLAIIIPGALVNYLLPATILFHLINPLAVALAIVVLITYGRGLIISLCIEQNPISPAHILIIGIMLNWIGIIARTGRWFFIEAEPIFSFDYAFYNVGLLLSILSALFLLWAAHVVVRVPSRPVQVIIASVVAGFLYYVDSRHLHFLSEIQ